MAVAVAIGWLAHCGKIEFVFLEFGVRICATATTEPQVDFF
jgi:hypothetical protein